LTRWPTWPPGRSRCKTTARPVGLVRPGAGAAGDGRPHHLQPGLQRLRAGRLEDLLGPDAGEEDLSLARRALALVQKLDPPGVGARDLGEWPAVAVGSRRAALRTASDVDRQPSGGPGAQPAAGYFAADGLRDRVDPGGARRTAKTEPKPGADFSNVVVTPVTPDVFVEWTKTAVPRAAGRDRHAGAVHQSILRKLFQDRPRARRPANTSSARSIRPMADRFDPATADTLLKVAARSSITKRPFSTRGPRPSKPLKMQQIADQVGVHVTT